MNVLPSMRDWNRHHVEEPRQRATERKALAALKQPRVKTACTADDFAAIASICPGAVNYPPATRTKRFARQIQGANELTDAQRLYVWQILWRFRRQIKDKTLVTKAKKVVDAN